MNFKNGEHYMKDGVEYLVQCNVDSIVHLTVNGLYRAKVDSTNKFRVRDNVGKWSAYSSLNFLYVKDYTGEATDDVAKEAVVAPSGKSYEIPSASDVTKRLDGGRVAKMMIDMLATKTVEAFEAKAAEIETYLKSVDPIDKEAITFLTENLKKAEEKKPMSTPIVAPKSTTKKFTVRDYLIEQGVKPEYIDGFTDFRAEHLIDSENAMSLRIPKINKEMLYRGGKVLNQAISALLAGEHILLEGGKATGKNVLSMNLAWFFGRPIWDISCHSHIDAASLIGSETLTKGEVVFKPGAVYECAVNGGFGVIDEINMAKAEAVAVLHSALDSRRVIDVSGYERIDLHPATRFIGTMNYGYAGTKELNEAFGSRFAIIHVPELEKKELVDLLAVSFPAVKKETLTLFAQVFDDLRRKAKNAEISTRTVDLRGLKAAIKMTVSGLKPFEALEIGIVNKAFEEYERQIVRDTVKSVIPETCTSMDKLVRI